MQNLYISKFIRFMGRALETDNVEGDLSLKRHTLYDDFDRNNMYEQFDWLVNEDHGGTGAINAAKNGTYRLTTSTVDNDKCELANSLIWYAEEACAIEARVKVDNITTVAINVGFHDVAEEADNVTAFRINGTTVEDTAAADSVCWVWDTDATTYPYWYMCNTKAGTEGGITTTSAPENAIYETFRIRLDVDGNARFYRNGKLMGYKYAAVTATVALTPYIAVISRANTAARNLDVDYIKCWQDRGPDDTS